MARESQKLVTLARRKRELEHGIKRNAGEEAITRSAERVRMAVLTVLKKYRPANFDQQSSDRDREWKALEDRWRSISIEEILDNVPRWSDSPGIGDVRKFRKK